MKTSESIIKIAPALLKAQKEIGSAKKGGKNPFFHTNYSTLGDVMEACKDVLNENGITILQPIGTNDCGVYVETVLLHESGEWIADGMKIASKNESDPQAQGSAISYAKRYSLQSMVFIPSEDDDAEKATQRKTIAHPVEEPTMQTTTTTASTIEEEPPMPSEEDLKTKVCSAHDEPIVMYKGQSKTKKNADGTPKTYWWHSSNGKMCFGSGYQD